MSARIEQIKKELKKAGNEEKARHLGRYFKTGKGEYAEGDKFLGLTVPETRKFVKKLKDLSIDELGVLLEGKFHEERSLALFALTEKFKKAAGADRKKIFDLYLRKTKYINNWDLVDLSAPNIVGEYLKDKDRANLYNLAASKYLWERRIAMLATFAFIKEGDCKDAIRIVEMLLPDKEDLMHKAVGWMLREVGKRCGEEALEQFLRKHIKKMSRTTLRYAIERFPEKKRKEYLNK